MGGGLTKGSTTFSDSDFEETTQIIKSWTTGLSKKKRVVQVHSEYSQKEQRGCQPSEQDTIKLHGWCPIFLREDNVQGMVNLSNAKLHNI